LARWDEVEAAMGELRRLPSGRTLFVSEKTGGRPPVFLCRAVGVGAPGVREKPWLAPNSGMACQPAARKVVEAFRPLRQHAARAIQVRPAAAQAAVDLDSKRAEALDYIARAQFGHGMSARRQESSPGLLAASRELSANRFESSCEHCGFDPDPDPDPDFDFDFDFDFDLLSV